MRRLTALPWLLFSLSWSTTQWHLLKDSNAFEQKNLSYIQRRRKQKSKWNRKSAKGKGRETALDRTGNCDLTTCCIGQCRPSSADITHLPSPTPSVNTPLSSSSSAPSSTTIDTPVLQSFTISTKTNVEYDHINQLLHTVHVNRYGDPELNEGWWQQSTDIEMDYMDVDPVNAYQDINATLRQAFLQRHHHPWYDTNNNNHRLPYITLPSSLLYHHLYKPFACLDFFPFSPCIIHLILLQHNMNVPPHYEDNENDINQFENKEHFIILRVISSFVYQVNNSHYAQIGLGWMNKREWAIEELKSRHWIWLDCDNMRYAHSSRVSCWWGESRLSALIARYGYHPTLVLWNKKLHPSHHYGYVGQTDATP